MKSARERFIKKEVQTFMLSAGESVPSVLSGPQAVVSLNASDSLVQSTSAIPCTSISNELVFSISSSSDDSSNSDVSDVEIDAVDTIRQWYLNSNCSLQDLDSLLSSLKPILPSLPLSHKTLLQCNLQNPCVHSVANGEFVYFGIRQALESHSHFSSLDSVSDIRLQFNFDGVPLFKSSDKGFWPILALDRRVMTEPVLVACFFGEGKPELEIYLDELISELQAMPSVSLGGVVYPVSLHLVIADLPARSYIKQTKGHSGYSSCHYCIIKGESGVCVYFIETDCELRTDESFRAQHDPAHHLAPTPFLSLHVDLVNAFPIDYMHASCLGVVRRTLLFLIQPKPFRRGRLHVSKIKEISDLLVHYRKDIPSEFSRKPRSLSHIKRFKATEFRQILLYTSLVIFPSFNDAFFLFKLLLVAHFILLDRTMSACVELVDYAGSLLKVFVDRASVVFGHEFVTMNVHSLVHLHQQVKQHGSLESFSAFPFESAMGKIKRSVKGRKHPLRELANSQGRLSLCKNRVASAEVQLLGDKRAPKAVIHCGVRHSATHPDCYIQVTSGDICTVLDIAVEESGDIRFSCGVIPPGALCNYFTIPCSSSDIGIFMCAKPVTTSHTISVLLQQITRKYVCFHREDTFSYAVVQFNSTNEYDVVSLKWMLSETECKYPDLKYVTGLARKNAEPHESWQTCSCRIIRKASNYQKARSALRGIIEEGSGFTTNEEVEKKRKRILVHRFGYDDVIPASDSDDANECVSLKDVELPVFPRRETLPHRRSSIQTPPPTQVISFDPISATSAVCPNMTPNQDGQCSVVCRQTSSSFPAASSGGPGILAESAGNHPLNMRTCQAKPMSKPMPMPRKHPNLQSSSSSVPTPPRALFSDVSHSTGGPGILAESTENHLHDMTTCQDIPVTSSPASFAATHLSASNAPTSSSATQRTSSGVDVPVSSGAPVISDVPIPRPRMHRPFFGAPPPPATTSVSSDGSIETHDLLKNAMNIMSRMTREFIKMQQAFHEMRAAMQNADAESAYLVSLLPMATIEDFTTVEEVLQRPKIAAAFKHHISCFSSRLVVDSEGSTRRALRDVLTDNLALLYNKNGQRGKRSFIATTVYRLIRECFIARFGAEEVEKFNKTVSSWLKMAPQRVRL